jgi:alpha-1,6-mannosyltransferase
LITQKTCFIAAGFLLLATQLFNRLISNRFLYELDLGKAPIVEFVGVNIVAGFVLLLLVWVIPRIKPDRQLFISLLIFGLAMRLLLFSSTPILELDFYRYLWDGAVVANGFNPYLLAPDQITNTELMELSQHAGVNFERINYADLRTIYPPLTQLFFALAYWADDWSLDAWRGLLLLADTIGFMLIIRVLGKLNRSVLWAALYWMNPLLILQTYNAAHMDVLLVAPLVGMLLLLLHQRYLMASAMITVAAGIKLWPLLLLPFALRPLLNQPARLITALTVVACLSAVFILPLLYYGSGEQSGIAAFTQGWQRNSALFPMLVSLLSQVTLEAEQTGRAIIAISLVSMALIINLKSIESPQALANKLVFIVAALFLLSPAQFPWYTIWFIPLLCFCANPAMLLLTALMPIYYLKFYFLFQGRPEFFEQTIVWFEYLPVILLLVVSTTGKLKPPAWTTRYV